MKLDGLFLVSGKKKFKAMRRKVQEIPKKKKIKLAGRILLMDGKVPATRMFVIQLAETQMEMAVGVRCQVGGNISGRMSHGIGPRPTAKQAIKATRKGATTLVKEGKEKPAEMASKQAATPAALKRATGLRPDRSRSQTATKVIPKLINERSRGIDSDPTIIIEE